MPALAGTVADGKAALVEIPVRQHITAVSECPVQAEGIVLLRCYLLENFSHPIGVSEIVRIGVVANFVEMLRQPCFRAADILSGLIVECHEIDGIAHLRKSGRSLDSCVCREIDAGDSIFSCRKFFGGYQQDAIRSSGSINSRRRSVFQNRNAFNVFRVDGCDVTFDTVDQNQRIGIAAGSYSTYSDGGVRLSRL